MRHITSLPIPNFWRRNCAAFLAFFWCAGLLLGSLLSIRLQEQLLPLMRTALSARVSIVRLFVLHAFPLVLSAAAIALQLPYCILPFAFVRAGGLAFVACGAMLAFGSSGWLICMLLMFTDICMLCPSVLFWLRHLSGRRPHLWSELLALLLVLLALCVADSLRIWPFAEGLLQA